MMAIAIGFILGLITGGGLGGQAGAYVGGILGMSLGLTVHGFNWFRAFVDEAPTLEHHRLFCPATGAVADAELFGDLARRRWKDVRRCSLQTATPEPQCDKTCLRLLNDAGVRPGQTGCCRQL